jgi:SAM-dependent methyltransferase
MSDSEATDATHEFGIGMNEVARLEAQGAALAPATRMILAEAGLRPGMRVLDLGCGAGDVTFAAAELVGPSGSVVGLDHSPAALPGPLPSRAARPVPGAVHRGRPPRPGAGRPVRRE